MIKSAMTCDVSGRSAGGYDRGHAGAASYGSGYHDGVGQSGLIMVRNVSLPAPSYYKLYLC